MVWYPGYPGYLGGRARGGPTSGATRRGLERPTCEGSQTSVPLRRQALQGLLNRGFLRLISRFKQEEVNLLGRDQDQGHLGKALGADGHDLQAAFRLKLGG